LFLDNKPLSVFKKPAHAYDFRKKVILAMKSRYLKAMGHRTHSGDALTGNEDISTRGLSGSQTVSRDAVGH